MPVSPGSRNQVAFFLLGVLNNLAFVTSIAHASDILPHHVAVVYLMLALPETLTKITAPYWWLLVSYRVKGFTAGFGFLINLLAVLLPIPVWGKLLGLWLGGASDSLGEATMLAYSQHFEDPSSMLSAWASGTGLAGPLGYLLRMYVTPHMGSSVLFLFSIAIVLVYWVAFLSLRPLPHDKGRGVKDDTYISVDDDAIEETIGLLNADRDELVSPRQGISCKEKLRLQCGLMKYVLPLVLTFFGAYAAQSGAWTAFALPPENLHSAAARSAGYQMLNLFYQLGVFISRSSGQLIKVPLRWLWVASLVQLLLLAFFVWDGAVQVMTFCLFSCVGRVGRREETYSMEQ